MNIKELKKYTPASLTKFAKEIGMEEFSHLSRRQLIFALIKKILEDSEEVYASGVIEILQDGFGFLRSVESNYLAGIDDIYVSPSHIKKNFLTNGDTVEGKLASLKKGEKYLSLKTVEKINFEKPHIKREKIAFDSLTPLYPEELMHMETESSKDISGRIIDIIAPIGKGQRALVVAPPRAGKTMILQSIARSIEKNHPEIHLVVLLIDERPEEVTEMSRLVKGDVVSSTFDEPAQRHVQVAEMVLHKVKRLVEYGHDVVVLLDSITRLARAYNTIIPSSGKVLTGGVDSNALQRPKRFLGAARNTEESGSLSIISTALTETGSKMDEVIFEEFKGTGNSELVIDRKIADKRIFPAIDVLKSGTRREELLVDKNVLSKTWVLRRVLASMGSIEGMEFLLKKVGATQTNKDFFKSMNS